MKLITLFALFAFLACNPLAAQWSGAFSGTGPSNASERVGLCDQPVDPEFMLIFGPPPEDGGKCTSSHVMVEYFSKVARWGGTVEYDWRPSTIEAFATHGMGMPITYTMYGSVRVAWPFADFSPAPKGFLAKYANPYPFPIMAAAQTSSIKEGACVPNPVKQVSPAYEKLNAKNCQGE